MTVAEELLAAVGGPGNVAELTHCWARLRFVLRNPALADETAVSGIPEVVLAVRQHGQFQVALRRNLDEVYESLASQLQGAGDEPTA